MSSVLASSIDCIVAAGAPFGLTLQPLDASQQRGVAVLQDSQPHNRLLTVTGELPQGWQLQAYSGKGGFTALLFSADRTLVYFLFPGAEVAGHGFCVTLEGQTLLNQPEAEKLFNAAATPLSPTAQTTPSTDNAPPVTTQAMILGAGIGTRILPLTDDCTGLAKPALPLDGHHTVIGRIVHQLAANGIQRVFVNTFHARPSVQQALQRACQETGLQWTEIPEDRATGTAGGLRTLLRQPQQFPTFNAQEPVLIVQGDAVTGVSFWHLLQAHAQANPLVTIGCQRVSDDDVSKFGIMATDAATQDNASGRITHFLEKPSLQQAGPHRLGSTGFYVLAPQAYAHLLQLDATLLEEQQRQRQQQADTPLPTEVEELDFAKHLFPYLLQNNAGEGMPLYAFQVEGFWCDIGNPAQYLQTLQAIQERWLKLSACEADTAPSDQYHANGVFYWPDTFTLAQQQGLSLQGGVLVARCR